MNEINAKNQDFLNQDIVLKSRYGVRYQGKTFATPVSPAINWTMLATHMTEINEKITEPHDSACFGSVSLAFFSILDENVDDNQATKTGEVYICDDGFKYERNVA